jgi:hypothetical protein
MRSSEDPVSALAINSLVFTVLSAVAIVGTCAGTFQGDAAFFGIFSLVIGLGLDFFSGKSWVAKLAVALQILVTLITIAAVSHFGGHH